MTTFTPHRLGQIIKAYRLEQKLTQAQLAAKSGTGLRFIVELERGKPTVQLGKVIAVADALGLMLMLQKDARVAQKILNPPQEGVRQFIDGFSKTSEAAREAFELLKKNDLSKVGEALQHLKANDISKAREAFQFLNAGPLRDIQSELRRNPLKPRIEP